MTDPGRLPRVAYVVLWFPKASETFVFREVANLRRMKLPVSVLTLYGELTRDLSQEMLQASRDARHLGVACLRRLPGDLSHWWRRNPSACRWLLRTVPLRRWRSLEAAGESVWAFLCGFALARICVELRIDHIHAAWAGGPATAAWVASRLTGIPFSFTGRAGDIYPPDGALAEKIRDSIFVRTNPAANLDHLASHCDGSPEKVVVVYDGCPLEVHEEAPVRMEAPIRLLAVGRLVAKKGFDVLLRATRQLQDSGVDFRLTIAGSGPRRWRLRRLAKRLGVDSRVAFPGFVSHDAVSELYRAADVFVMPSVVDSAGDRDGLPNVIAEALLHRLPVIATDVGGIGELIRDGETGRLVEQADPWGLARVLAEVVREREASLEMAERGRALVLDMLDPERCHRQVLELFRRAHWEQAARRA